ncbi:hypothetical protein [Flavobacterium polysaccharolyticum]|uniref:Uncharacterized protein n=1 Tax=Flavobacterium polysaccharolyticum TaxID=3133148 RepID=A0ABU9NNW3_9FLAO
MNAIYYNIKDDKIVHQLKERIQSKIARTQWMETLVLIEPEKFHFKDIVNLLYEFFKQNQLDIEDFVYVHNFSGYDEDKWYCERVKKQGLKRISTNFK